MDSVSDDPKFQFLQERYEQRLRQLLALVQSTNQDLRADDLITAMKADPLTQPFAQQRGNEVWDNVLGKEREAMITGLMTELAEAKRTIRNLETRLTASHRSLQSAEDRLRFEAEKTDSLIREADKLKETVTATNREYEENTRKRESEAFGQTARVKSEYEKLKSDYGRLEEEYDNKTRELEAMDQDLAERDGKIQSLEAEVQTLGVQLERQADLHRFHEKMSAEYKESDALMQDRVTSLTQELSRLTLDLRESQTQQQRLESLLKQMAESHRKTLDALGKRHTEESAAAELRFDEELREIRTKLANSKSQNQELELQLQESQRSVEAVRERWQKDVEFLRTEHQQTRSSLEKAREHVDKSYEQKEAEMKKQHETDIDALHKHYKQLVLEKGKLFEQELSEEREKWRLGERTGREQLTRIMEDLEENYILKSEFSAILEEKDTTQSLVIKKLTSELENSTVFKLKQQAEKMKKDQETVLATLIEKLKTLEEEKDTAMLGKRKAEEDLQAAELKISSLETVLKQTNSDLENAQKARTIADQELTKTTREVTELNSALALEKKAGFALQGTIETFKTDLRTLQDRLRTQELFYKSQLLEQAGQEREQQRLLEAEADQYKALCDQMRTELGTYKRLNGQLEAERDRAFGEVAQREINSQETVKNVRAEEAERANNAYQTLKDRLSSSESTLSSALSELASFKTANSELKLSKAKTDEELLKASRRLSELEAALTHVDKQYKELKVITELAKVTLKNAAARHAKQTRKMKQFYRTEISQLQSAVFQELHEYKKALSSVTSRCLIGVDDRVMGLQRGYQLEIIERQEQAESLQRRMEASKLEAQARLKAKETEHEGDLFQLTDQNQGLIAKLRALEKDNKSFHSQLEEARKELTRREEERSIRNRDHLQLQDRLRKSQEEKSVLREQAKAEMDVKLQMIQAEYEKEMQRIQRENLRAKTASEESLGQLKTEVEALQIGHNDEVTKMMTLCKQKLSEKDSIVDTLRRTVKQQVDEIAQLRSDIILLRRQAEGPLDSLQSEVEALVSGLRLDQVRYQKQLVLKDRQIEELKSNLRRVTSDAGFRRSLEEDEIRPYHDSEDRKGRLSLSQLAPK